jgi:hypothetical protein
MPYVRLLEFFGGVGELSRHFRLAVIIPGYLSYDFKNRIGSVVHYIGNIPSGSYLLTMTSFFVCRKL